MGVVIICFRTAILESVVLLLRGCPHAGPFFVQPLLGVEREGDRDAKRERERVKSEAGMRRKTAETRSAEREAERGEEQTGSETRARPEPEGKRARAPVEPGWPFSWALGLSDHEAGHSSPFSQAAAHLPFFFWTKAAMCMKKEMGRKRDSTM